VVQNFVALIPEPIPSLAPVGVIVKISPIVLKNSVAVSPVPLYAPPLLDVALTLVTTGSVASYVQVVVPTFAQLVFPTRSFDQYTRYAPFDPVGIVNVVSELHPVDVELALVPGSTVGCVDAGSSDTTVSA
jgi:hypothetical protein